MSIFPVTAPSVQPPENSPRLDYRMYLFTTGAVEVTSILGPCLNFAPDRGARLAVSFDDEAPQVLTVVPKGYFVDNGHTRLGGIGQGQRAQGQIQACHFAAGLPHVQGLDG